MNKPLLLSLVTAALLGTTSLSADNTMYDRFQQMELQMKQMKQELDALKAEKAASAESADAEEADDEADDEADEDEEKVAVASKESADDEADDEDEDDEESIEDKVEELQENVAELNKNTNSNHLKFGVDYRFAIENLDYKMADGSKAKNDAFMTNRFWMNMSWAATENLSFHGQLAYNKAFGARSGASNPANASFETFDWVSNENAYDDKLRVRSVYFLYKDDEFAGADIPWTFSIGRRPSTNGHLINLRDDDHASSPMGHSINVEFDGLSAKFGLESLTGVDGMYVKFCAGRGMSNAAPKFTSTPYSSVDSSQGANPNIDLAGLIFVPYDNGQYSINTQYYYANNLIDAVNPQNQPQGFTTVGGMHSITANFIANGIGDGLSDFLDDTIFFVSGAMSITDPKKDQKMLDATAQDGESKTGYSYWVGTQFPSLISEEGRWGLEYNHGTQYWRSITYAEDTNIGSKVAARGDAYEAYFTEPLVDDIFSLQIRYTYIDYKYAGSNGFFGATSGDASEISSTMPGAANYVDKAQDIRFYLRYRY
ncbi:DUF3373 family protein [Sulfurimonas paralvinellae]|uniref:DUF3373 domain-containing protein n=1 Tax=Sulfurimonas paralvinellae TaxID=317658 RepID=A0A7M1B5U7_9BACT|nr:DUF3373 family protein [Sulfurimonas paralvinellae]QOP45071.1 DUF3373 domain-containing protein [Sulfurimonas paralvinellae]